MLWVRQRGLIIVVSELREGQCGQSRDSSWYENTSHVGARQRIGKNEAQLL